MKWESKPILQFRKDGSFIRRIESTYKSSMFGDEKGAFNSSSVARCARGERKSYRGYIWIFESEYTDERLAELVVSMNKRWSSKNKPVVQLSIDGEFIDRFDSITQARDKFLLSNEMSIINVIKNKKWCDTCCGYKWMYEEDYNRMVV